MAGCRPAGGCLSDSGAAAPGNAKTAAAATAEQVKLQEAAETVREMLLLPAPIATNNETNGDGAAAAKATAAAAVAIL